MYVVLVRAIMGAEASSDKAIDVPRELGRWSIGVDGVAAQSCEHFAGNKGRTGRRRSDDGIHPYELKRPEKLDFRF
jgi:hypothetical protein